MHQPLEQVSIKNEFLSLKVLNYGARIQELLFRDKKGNWQNMVVGLKGPEEYLKDSVSLGACVGRFAGRISSGGFTLDEVFYPLHNEAGIHLHGGKEGFAYKYWEIMEVSNGNVPYIKLSYSSPHLEEGYPGDLRVNLTYQLEKNSLKITHEATTDRNTVVNLTNHSYFKLDEENSVSHYELQLGSKQVLETHSDLLPTGKLLDIDQTEWDFQELKAIGQTRFDTPFTLHSNFVARVSSPRSGIRMQVTTNQPAVVVFTPPWFAGICFETQNYPDTPNIPAFPSCLLKAGETYLNQSIFTFDLVP
ncbi:galactose mutarotase [Flavobacteriaceae bacterium D16]|nr:galactose mutarotase [Flavobacteriaceae bacterium D16]